MGLKFRRGTTAQQSGSLAFGEPYVNTTLGTLVVGGPNGDIVLGASGTGSTGNFGAISGSGLDITGNANIAGNVTVGGQLTIGDNTSDTVNVVASLSSSLIPSANNVFDLGSPTKIWRDLYISTGSIKMMDGAGNEVSVLSSTAAGMVFDNDIRVNGVVVGQGGGNQLGNTILGDWGLSSNTTGNNNTIVGSGAGGANTTGTDNTYVGRLTGFSNNTAQGNTAVGAESIYENTGSANTAVGYGALKRLKNGGFNVALGYLAGQYATGSSNNNVFIGYNNGPQTDEEVNNQLYIGPGYNSSLIRGNFTGAELRINGKLDVLSNTVLSGSLTMRGHILPATTNLYDLGSATHFWRDIYVSTGSIRFVGAAGTVVGTLTNVGNGLNLDSGIVANGNSSFGTSSLAVTSVTGSLAVNGRIIANSITGAIAATNGVISGSSQLTSSFDSRYVLESETGSLQNSITLLNVASASLNTTTASLNTSVSNLNTTTASLNTSVSNLNTTTASLNTSVSNLNSFTSSINTTIKSKLDADGVISGSSQILNASGLVSGSSQITLSATTGFSAYSTSVDSRIATEKGRVDAILLAADADKDSFAEIVTLINSVDLTNDTSFASFYTASVGRLNNLESTSASVNISVSNLNTTTASLNTSVSNLNTYTGSNDTTNTTQNTRLTALEASASTALSTNTTQTSRLDQLSTASGSAITRLTALEVETANLESFTSSINTTIKSKLDADGVISGSAQLTTTFDARYLNTGGDSVVSGSSQIAFSGVTGTVSNAQLANSAITIAGTSTSLGGTISAATIGNAIGAFSGSAQIAHDSTTGYVANRHIDHTAVSISAGSGLSGGGDISATRTLSIASGGVTNDMLAGSIANAKLTNSTISGIALGSNLATLTIGTGLSGTSYNGSTGVTIANTGVTSNVAGTGISVSSGTGAVTITNTGVTSNVAGTGVTVSGGTGAVTISIGQAVATSSNVQFNSLGVGMAASATAGRIDATNDVVAFSSSDIRFKENIKTIENPIEKIKKISGNTYDWKAENKIEHGYEGNDVGVIAQEIEAVLPQLVQTRESGYKAVKYDKLVALLIEGIKEQQIQIDNLTVQVEELKKQKGL